MKRFRFLRFGLLSSLTMLVVASFVPMFASAAPRCTGIADKSGCTDPCSFFHDQKIPHLGQMVSTASGMDCFKEDVITDSSKACGAQFGGDFNCNQYIGPVGSGVSSNCRS